MERTERSLVNSEASTPRSPARPVAGGSAASIIMRQITERPAPLTTRNTHVNSAVASVVERALEVCRYRLEKEKIRLRTVIAGDLPLVRMDEDAMSLVLLNLVDNAAKYGADVGTDAGAEAGMGVVAIDRLDATIFEFVVAAVKRL